MHRTFVALGALTAALAVGLGAFGAHAMKDLVGENAVATFDTATRYMLYHSFALILCGILYNYAPGKLLLWSGRFFAFGLLFFCGSLIYIAFMQAIVQPMMRWVGPVTPVGGLLFILGWLLMAIAAMRLRKK